MINLPNGCSSSELKVYPKNWQSKSAKITSNWYIKYRFYDPRFASPKQVMIKGMNQFKDLSGRQGATLKALEIELHQLSKEGYNPFLKSKISLEGTNLINPQTPILDALKSAYAKIEVSSRTRLDLKFVLSSVGKTIQSLGFSKYQISQVTRKTVKLILEAASNSPDRFNKNRSYLMILFAELCELELIETNPVRDIRKKKTVKHIREVLTDEERISVDKHLKNNYPEFHRFLNIFFHLIWKRSQKTTKNKVSYSSTFIVYLYLTRVYEKGLQCLVENSLTTDSYISNYSGWGTNSNIFRPRIYYYGDPYCSCNK